MFDFTELYEEIIGRVGGEQSTAEDVLKVERAIRIVLERWAAKRYPTWRVRQMRIGLSGSVPYVDLPDTVEDIMQAGVVTDETVTTLKRIHQSVYAQLSTKHTTGMPGQFALGRTPEPRMYLFPIGEPGMMLELWYIERMEPYDAGDRVTDDIPGRWLEALICTAAHDVARKRPSPGGMYDEPLIQRLAIEAEAATELALDADRDRASFKYRVRI